MSTRTRLIVFEACASRHLTIFQTAPQSDRCVAPLTEEQDQRAGSEAAVREIPVHALLTSACSTSLQYWSAPTRLEEVGSAPTRLEEVVVRTHPSGGGSGPHPPVWRR